MARPPALPTTESANGHIRTHPSKTRARMDYQEKIAREATPVGKRVPAGTGNSEETSQTRYSIDWLSASM